MWSTFIIGQFKKGMKFITRLSQPKTIICFIKFYTLLLQRSYTHCYVITKGRGIRPNEALATL